MDARIPISTPAARRCGLLTACALAGASLVAADEARAPMQVGASVAPQARLDARLPPRVLVTAHDVGRGFVLVTEPSRLDVRTNARAFVLDVGPLGVPFTSVAISGLEQPVEFGSDGGSIVRRVADVSRPVALVLHYRLRLDASAAPGAYAWPVRFVVRPLDLQ